jgi:hypothetical protein
MASYGAVKFMQLLTTGGGLTASAVALDASAAALSAAAAALGGGKVAAAAAGAAASAAGAAGTGGIWAAGAAALPWAAGGLAAAGGLIAMRAAVDDAGYAGMTSGERMRKQRGGSMRDMYAREWGYPTGVPEMSPTMTYGTGVSGDKGATSVQLTGSAEVKGEGAFTVTASSELITIVGEARKVVRLAGQFNANGNGPGSTGRSSPDATAPVSSGRSTTGDSGRGGGASGAW